MDQIRLPPLERLRPGHWVAIDCAVTALLLLGYVAAFRALADLQAIPRWAGAVIIAVAVLPAAARRRWPGIALALVAAGGAAATALSVAPSPALAVAFVMYLIPLRFGRPAVLRLLAGALAAQATAVAAFAVIPHGGYGTGDAIGLLLQDGLLITAAWMTGFSVRQQRAYAAGRQEQAERQAREELARARQASSEERLRIARELHDVVAHAMSLIVVQAGVANYVTGEHPEEAARALVSIEQTSRGALREMRALLGVLRDGETGLGPSPGLADLGSLAGRTQQAGVRVDLDVSGERPHLPAGLELAAYRVIQEAVTNVVKHAATDSCLVTVACREDELTLEITDSGSGAGAGAGAGRADPVAGHGIAGMRERVGRYGGDFQAAPLPGRGFRVTARFPLADSGG